MRRLALVVAALVSSIVLAPAADARRDPFRSPLELEAVATPASVLESFDLDQLRVEGIISGTSDPTALVVTPTGEGFVVHRGTPMGKQGGRIARITREEVVVSETRTDGDGTRLTSEQALRSTLRGEE